MGVVKGLGAITKHIADEEAKFSGEGKARWFKIGDKQSVKVLFLQELDPDSENFSQKNDLGLLAVEHANPKAWQRKALCTIDDGQCYGCEQHAKDYKAGWGQKNRLYINVLVDDGKDEPYVAVLSQGNGPKSVTPALIEYATEDGTITDKFFTIKRTGSGSKDTSYLLMPKSKHDLNVEDYELFDLNSVFRDVPYEAQAAHYNNNVAVEETSEVKDTQPDAEW